MSKHYDELTTGLQMAYNQLPPNSAETRAMRVAISALVFMRGIADSKLPAALDAQRVFQVHGFGWTRGSAE